MAKKYVNKFKDGDGVWRTIGGRRVFIKTGQKLSEAMEESGKFPKTKSGHVSREDVVKGKRDLEIDELKKKYNETWDRDDFHNLNTALVNQAKFENDYNYPREYSGDMGKIAGKHVHRIDKSSLDMKGLQDKESTDFMLGEIEKEKKEVAIDRVDKRLAREKQSEYDRIKLESDNRQNNWREQIKKNDEQLEKDLENYKKTHDISRESDGYYELFRENERRNAKIKKEVPTEPYEYVGAYAGYRDKSYSLAGTKMEGKDVVEYGNKSWSGKEYTNDEFMEHLEDSNWHSERKMLLEAGLTNQELAYIKDRTTLSQWSVGEELTGSKNTQKMIDEAKAKFRVQDVSPMSEWSDTTGTGFSDLQSSTLKTRFKDTYKDLKETTDMSEAEILELLKKIAERTK